MSLKGLWGSPLGSVILTFLNRLALGNQKKSIEWILFRGFSKLIQNTRSDTHFDTLLVFGIFPAVPAGRFRKQRVKLLKTSRKKKKMFAEDL